MVPPSPPADARSSHSGGSRKQLYLAGLASSGKVCPVTAACSADAPQLTAADGKEDASTSSERNWADLPEALLEKILSHVKLSSELLVPKAMFPACGVCSSWRAAGLRLFFASPWQEGGSICHPAGLFLLTPPNSNSSTTCTSTTCSGHTSSTSTTAAATAAPAAVASTSGSASHVKCFVRREVVSSGIGGRLHKFTLYQGADFAAGDGKFLLSALQESKQRYAIHLNRALSGRPCARLASNVMRTAYNLTPERSAWMDGVLAQQEQQARRAQQQQQQQEWQRQQQEEQEEGQQGASTSEFGSRASSPVGSSSNAATSSSCAAGASGSLYAAASSSGGAAAGGSGSAMLASSSSAGHEEGSWAEEPLARVHYKLRVRGMMLPRRMSVALPCPPHLQQYLLQQQQRQRDGAADERCGCGVAHGQQGQQQGQGQQEEQDVPVPMPDLDDDLLQEVDQDVAHPAMHAGPSAAEAAAAAAAGAAAGAGAARHSRSHSIESTSPWPSSPHCQHSTSAAATAATPGAAAPALKLKNKPPHWNETLRCWCLNFRGRVKLASVKNFQLTVASDKSGAIAMQFGKVDKNAFILDFNPALVTAAQAFAVALTTFESKVLL